MAEDLQMSWPSGGSEDVRGRDIDRVRSEAEAVAVLDDETGCLDRGERVAARVTVLARALRFGNVTKAFVDASEDRVVDLAHGLML
jgi:O-methyltransferase involved in polyketide biosynthesis